MTWQDISSAPKDGTRILVWTIHGDVELSDWFVVKSINYVPVEGTEFFRRVETEREGGWNSNTPTHWQPLPDPPEAA
jgi:hypothetical protein